MSINSFAQQIKAAQQRLEEMWQRASQTSISSELLSESLEELSIHLETFQVMVEDLADTQATLAVERQRYQELFNLAPDGYLVTNGQGVIQEVNRAAITLFNQAQDYLLGKPLSVFIAQAGRSGFRRMLNQLQQGKDITDLEVYFQLSGGRSFHTAIRVSAVRDPAGELVSLYWLLRDISDRKQTEIALEEREQQLAAITANLPGSVYRVVLHSDGKMSVPFVSAGISQLSGLEPAELMTTPERLLNTIHPDDRAQFDQVLREACETLQPTQQEFRIVTKLGQLRWIQDTARYFRLDNGDVIVDGVGLDITERKQAELALQQATEELETRVQERTAALRELNQQLVSEIAERQRVEEALRHSERRFQKLVANLPGMIYQFQLHPDGSYSFPYISPGCREFYEREPEEIQQNAAYVFDQIHPDDQPGFESSIQVSAQTLQPWNYEWRVMTRHNHNKWAQGIARPEKQANGEILWDGLLINITQRKQALAALQESEERFCQLVENIDQIFWISTPNRAQFFYVSPAYETIWGHSCESLYEDATSWLAVVHPEDHASLLALLEERCGQASEEEYRIIHPDGSIHWIRNCAFPVRNQQGEVYRLTGITEDITERKRVEEEVRFLQAMTQAIFESQDFHSALAVALQKVGEATGWNFGEAWIPCPEHTVLECSPAWYASTDNLEEFRKLSEGMTFAPGVGLPGRVWSSQQPEWCRDVSAESDQIYLRAKAAFVAGLKAGLGIPIIVNDEVLAVLIFYMFEARDQDEHLIELIAASAELGLFIQRKRTEEEIRKALEKERELNELKSSFISMVSHEFRTPLSTIVLSTDLLENYSHKYTLEKKQEYFQRLRSAARRMTKLLEDVLLIGKAEAGKLELNPAPLDLEKFCQDLVEELQLSAATEYTLTFRTQGQCHNACMDEKLLQHIFTNLLSNAIKYSPKGGNIRFFLSCQNGLAEFKISDEGIGISLEDQQHLFQPFHRASNVGTIPGTGLGLAIVRNCVDIQGGRISVESEVGVGTTFIVSLPMQPLNFSVQHFRKEVSG